MENKASAFDKKVSDRAATLHTIYDQLKTSRLQGVKVLFRATYMNSHLLSVATRSYFLDINRTKIFHKIKLADRHKQCGYTMKWISKIRPIQLFNQDIYGYWSHLANEAFAFYCGTAYLELPDDFSLDDNSWQALLYTLHYRELSGDHLSLLSYFMEKSANK